MERPPFAQTPRPAPQRDGEQGSPQAFSIVLVLGDMQTTAIQDNVPAAARKALADMKDFLPYKGYRLLDAQWTLCCGNSPITSRLKGADDQEYDLQLSVSPSGSGRVTVRFYLSEPSAGAMSARAMPRTAAETRAQALNLEQQIEKLRQQYNLNSDRFNDRHSEQIKISAQIAELQREMAAVEAGGVELKSSAGRAGSRGSRGVIDASFRMDVGETVVVGTSRTRGDKALIALLTAVPPKASTGRD